MLQVEISRVGCGFVASSENTKQVDSTKAFLLLGVRMLLVVMPFVTSSGALVANFDSFLFYMF